MVNIKDVAERAGVSNATVSRVLANKPHVSESIRRQVLQAVEELNYRPDQTAQRLRAQNTSRLIGLVISGVLNSHFNAIIHGVSDLAYKHHMNLLFCNAVGDTKRERYYLDLMRSERAAGLIVNPQDERVDGRYLDEVQRNGTAVILIDTTVADYAFDYVGVENRLGAYRAVRHLLNLGHHRIATITGKLKTTTGQERLQGYRDALTEAGLPTDDSLVKIGEFDQDTAYHVTHELLDAAVPPTALFVANEPMTIGALSALKERGIRIPHDMAVVSFDDTPWSAHVDPPITTISQPTYALGREAVRLLLRRIDEPAAPRLNVLLPTELIIRRSCGANLS